MVGNMRFVCRHITLSAVAATLAFVASATPAQAAIITLDYSGTYDIKAVPVLGEIGLVPFHYSLTYDTSLGAQTEFRAAGTQFGPGILAEDMYRYSAAGITSASLTFGTKVWNGADVLSFLVNTDLTVAAPTKTAITLQNGQNSLSLGKLVFFQGSAFFELTSTIVDTNVASAPVTLTTTFTSTAVPAPEPASMLLLGTGLIGLAGHMRGRRGR